ncbi:regulator [Streptomyces sp. NBC_00257]|uniref:regulator n=1 Tax=unclassified Streptomyces TaxID=2593676 RepID=UPI002253D4C8|nr:MULTISPECIES: regulator [unclassified Streptomyces]WTB53899.1 regulator [Streptomyces sp. NBC_00826]WTH93213.1 regulator [Streptomyces sp. NBC_00825]WTI01945.1 regulator [Streptomyces sp. NBC_00822]MCX4867547.1 regulator [Streptomyces sp. NBC_00906]MCX4898785.1 regulator [Streptomyces sp. NBC_00892]
MSDRPPQRTPNRRLASLITEAGFSNAGLARRVDQLGLEHGLDLRYDKTSVTRWLRGQQPRGTTPALIAEVFTRRLGRRLSAQDLGLDACAPVYAGLEFAATPAEAVDIVSGLWRKDSGSHAELRKIAFTPAGLVVPSRDWLIGRADEWVGRGSEPVTWTHGGAGGDHGTAGTVGTGRSAGTGGAVGAAENGGAVRPGAPGGARGAPYGAHGGAGVNGAGARAGARGPAPSRPSGPSAPPGSPTAPTAPAPPGAGLPGAPGVPRQRQSERAPGQRVSGGDVAALRSVGELFRTLDNAYGGGHARQALVRYLEHETEPMLRGSYGEATGRRLFSAAADLTRLAGWTSYDIAAHGLAQRYFVQALRLAQAAGDRAYGSYVLITMSRQAVYLGHGREAVQLARVAQQGIGSSAPPVVQALLHAVEARGHGVLGEARPCTTSLARAEHALEIARPGDEVPHWARYFDEAQLADEFGHCHRDLQQYRAAAQHAERSLQLRSPAYARSRLFCRVVLASARLGLGELDQACALGAEAAQQAAEMRSVRAAEYVRDFERRLEPYRDAAAVRGYRDRVATLG